MDDPSFTTSIAAYISPGQLKIIELDSRSVMQPARDLLPCMKRAFYTICKDSKPDKYGK